MSRINPATIRVVKTIKTGGRPTNLGVATDAIWVGDNSSDGQSVFRIDPATNTSISVPDRPRPSERDHRHAQCRLDRERRQHRRPPRPGHQLGRRDRQGGPDTQQGDVARDGTIWVPNQFEDTISVIDPQTNTVVRKVKTGSAPFVVRTGFGDMWVGSFRDAALWRIRP